jgi:RimJ/RimL family protein N-acetyltransferase
MVRFIRGGPYSPGHLLDLPVRSGALGSAVEYYVRVFGFAVAQRTESPRAAALLVRDGLTMGLEENGRDPEQEGAFIEVDDIDAAYAELDANGLGKAAPDFTLDYRPAEDGEPPYYNKVFFVIAPDGLCYCLGHRADLVRENMPLLDTERWALQPPAASRDAEVHALFNDDAAMLPFLAVLHNLPAAAWAERRERHRAGFADLSTGPLFMDLIWKETGAVVGAAGFPQPVDRATNSVEWGVVIHPSHQRRGLCDEIFDACREFAKEKLGLPELVADTVSTNTVMREFLVAKGLRQTAAVVDPVVEGWKSSDGAPKGVEWVEYRGPTAILDGLEVIDCHTHFADPAHPKGIVRSVLPTVFKQLVTPMGVTGTIVTESADGGGWGGGWGQPRVEPSSHPEACRIAGLYETEWTLGLC